MRNKTAVIGLGNILLSDEGAGVRAIELLRNKLSVENDEPNVDLIDAGTPGMNLLHEFDERKKIIFVDSGNCGLTPGEYKRFIPGDVISLKTSHNSPHEFDLIQFLDFARQMSLSDHVEVVIYCIQAAQMVFSEELSADVRENLPHLVEDIYREIKKESRVTV
ncbi:MAG: hydrogenase maturation protease [Candidatus Omnitrophota bacterium]